VGGAVERNRVKRLIREAFVTERERLPEGTDVVVVARKDAWALAEREGLAGMQRALGDLISRAGRSSDAGESESKAQAEAEKPPGGPDG
jgi:ribonuclease P protein component